MPEEVKKHKKAVCGLLPGGGQVHPGRRCEADCGRHLHQFCQDAASQDCCYVLYDAIYQTKEGKKKDLMFTIRTPECPSVKSKMIYVSSKDAIKKKLAGIKHGS